MKISKKISNVAAILVTLSTAINVQAMNEKERTLRNFDAKRPLKEWPTMDLLRTQKEKEIYKRIWHKEKTLEENQKELIKQFIDTCCNFSFKKQKTRLRGIYVGKIDEGEEIVFTDKGTFICAKSDLSHILLCNSKYRRNGLKVQLTTSFLPNMRPLSLNDQMKDKIKGYVKKLAEDSVGCELLRVAVAKYRAQGERLPKIIFIPINKEEIGLSYTTGSYIWKQMGLVSAVDNILCKEYSPKHKYILFSPKWLDQEKEELMIRYDKKTLNDGFEVYMDNYPTEAGFMHQMLHALHDDIEIKSMETKIISERSAGKYFCSYLRRRGLISLPTKDLNISIFANDEIYRTMFGLVHEGRESINEAAYLSHRYKFIRPTIIGSQTKLKLNDKKLSKEESYEFLRKFLELRGDRDLYEYYLSSKSTIKYPEFGEGQYECSDIIPISK